MESNVNMTSMGNDKAQGNCHQPQQQWLLNNEFDSAGDYLGTGRNLVTLSKDLDHRETQSDLQCVWRELKCRGRFDGSPALDPEGIEGIPIEANLLADWSQHENNDVNAYIFLKSRAHEELMGAVCR